MYERPLLLQTSGHVFNYFSFISAMHTISFLAVVALEGEYKLTGGGLPSTFKAAQFHLHWGSENDRGSEHTVNEKSYPAEVIFSF